MGVKIEDGRPLDILDRDAAVRRQPAIPVAHPELIVQDHETHIDHVENLL